KLTIVGPNEMLSTKWPSMMSQWIQSAPASSALRTSPARFEKSAARMDGATITFGIGANVQRSTLNVQCSIEVWSLWALGFRASAQPPLYIKSLTAGRAVSCYRVSAGKNPPARRTDCYEGRQWRFQTGGKINSCSTDFLASYPATSVWTSGRTTPWFTS